MTQRDKKKFISWAIEFVKLQAAGNILFWGTYIGYFALHELANWEQFYALVTASLVSHFLFFLANKNWVFDDKTGERKTSSEVRRFIIFMGVGFFINLGIIQGLSYYFGITPYIGQFISAMFFVVWNFVGLKWWVFEEPVTPYKKRYHAKRTVESAK